MDFNCVGRRFHDAEVVGINRANGDSDIVIGVFFTDRTKGELTLVDCKFFRAVDFVQQNIVSQLKIYEGTTVNKDFFLHQMRWMTSQVDAVSDFRDADANEIFEQILAGTSRLVVITPSAGLEFSGLCRLCQFREF